MTDDNQNETMPTPQPLPGQVFIRPGIDDRPDYEKTLTREAKAALKRLAVQQRPRAGSLQRTPGSAGRPPRGRRLTADRGRASRCGRAESGILLP